MSGHKAKLRDVLNSDGFEKKSGTDLHKINDTVGKDQGQMSKSCGSLSDHRPKAPKAPGKLGF